MLDYIIILLVINILFTFITDLTDWPTSLKKFITWCITGGKMHGQGSWSFHLIDCSLCQIFHASWIFTLIYCIYGATFSPIMLALICLNAFFGSTIRDILIFVKDFIAKVNRTIYKIFKIDD